MAPALALALSAAPLHAQGPAPAEVYILATLYQRHATTPAYTHDSLHQIIRGLKPDAVVLDVSPNELQA